MNSKRLRARIFVAIAVCIAFVAVGCDNGTSPLPSEQLEVAMREVADAQTQFGFELYRELASHAGGESVFISPVSVHTALSMAHAGARGETQDAMASAMSLGQISPEQLGQIMRALVGSLDADSLGAQLDIANGLWYRQDHSFAPDYITSIEEDFRAQIAALDFRDPSSPGIVNQWVSERTNGLIPDLIEQIDPDLVMLLVNAVYFKGDWTEPFDPGMTRPLPFTLASGEAKSVPMMYKDGRIDHLHGQDFQAIRLPYGDEERLAMYVFLPSEDVGLEGFVQLLTLENWHDWMDGFRPKQGQVRLPRMDVAYKSQLNRALQAMGMGVAFDPQKADFSGMRSASSGDNLSISEVTHKTVLKVSEEGTEAAGATSIGIRVTSLPMYEFEFVANRPFFVAIRDDVTGSLLFAGSITDPGTEKS